MYRRRRAQTLDLVDAWAMTQPKPEEVFVWLEPLCTDLHRPTEAGPLWWGSVFKGGVKEIGRTLLLLDPWENAPVLRRSWSLYHLHCTLASKDTELEMTMSDDAADRLQQALIDDMTSVENTLDGKSDGGWRKLAEASKPEHKALVERMIEKSPDGGWDGFSDKLLDELSAWLLERAKAALASLSEEERPTSKLLDRVVALLQEHGKVEEAEPLLKEQVDGRTKKFGARHAETLDSVNNYALLLHQLGKLEEAEPYSRAKLDACRALLGEGHPDTITAVDTLSQLLSDLNKLEEALPLKRESLSIKRKQLGDRHPDTLLSVNNLAVLLNDLGRASGSTKMLREAEPLKREALAGCREVLGNRHPHTLASVANLADMLMQLGHADPRALDEAEPLCREAMSGSHEVLGEGHPDTLKSVGMLAALLTEQAHYLNREDPRAQRKLKEAEPLYARAARGFKAAFGAQHPTALSYVHEHARLLLDMRKPAEAERLQLDALAGCRAALGDSHPETLITITHMAGVYRAQAKMKEAEPLCREVLAGWRVHEQGEPVQRNTLTAANILAELLHSAGKDVEAEPLCREVLAGFRAAVGESHPFTVSAAENLAGVLRTLKKPDEADDLLQRYGLKAPLDGIGEGDEEDEGEESRIEEVTANGHSPIDVD